MIRKVTRQEIKGLTAQRALHISAAERDEMAIPSYLHSNPLIPWLMWKRYETIFALAHLSPSMKVLEFGCGLGVFLPQLDLSCGEVYATDLFPDFAKALCQQLKLATIFIDTLEEIPDSTMDVIIAADVLEHIDNVPSCLETFSSKLSPGGRLIVSGPTENLLYKIGRAIAGFQGKGEYHHTNIKTLVNTIAQQGFCREQAVNLPFAHLPALFTICSFRKRQA